MSTSLETSPKASPSNNARAAALARAAFVSACALAFIAVCEFPWSYFTSQIAEKRQAEASVAPLVEQARLWPMTYETAEAGKPVVWCIDHPAKDVSYLEGKPSQPILWTDTEKVPMTFGNAGSHCAKMVAYVQERRPQAVVLRFVAAL